ncbi:MAG TPA: flagellar motor switch protein FliN [Phycisphaerales bacterium]|nr:flagellar motor switch protein FliN [Phycisphaerales bacterium]HCD33510.1 flagellar motor switch protein FliN [Phycisphaerales bacterium]|tara:strand:+ start:114 stop:563 length:450 start_codon:yes stop_codon:yes gene_type:complete
MAETPQQPDSNDNDTRQEAAKIVQNALDDASKSVTAMHDVASEALGDGDIPGSLMDSPDAPKGIDMLRDVDLHVAIELGRTNMLVEDVLKIGDGSVIELDKLAGDPVDVYVNDRLVARGEVLVLNDNFCIRVSEIVANLEDEAEAAKAS